MTRSLPEALQDIWACSEYWKKLCFCVGSRKPALPHEPPGFMIAFPASLAARRSVIALNSPRSPICEALAKETLQGPNGRWRCHNQGHFVCSEETNATLLSNTDAVHIDLQMLRFDSPTGTVLYQAAMLERMFLRITNFSLDVYFIVIVYRCSAWNVKISSMRTWGGTWKDSHYLTAEALLSNRNILEVVTLIMTHTFPQPWKVYS